MMQDKPQTEIYTIQLEDGSQIDVEGPAGANEAQLHEFLSTQGVDASGGQQALGAPGTAITAQDYRQHATTADDPDAAIVFGDEAGPKTGFRFEAAQEQEIKSAILNGDAATANQLANQYSGGRITFDPGTVAKIAEFYGKRPDLADQFKINYEPTDTAAERAANFETYRGHDEEPIEDLRRGDVLPEGADAFARGAALGFDDEIDAIVNTLFRGGTLDDNLARARAIQKYDEENHPWLRTAGALAGSAVLPTRVISNGVSIGRTAGLAAYREARAAGVGVSEARAAAEQAAKRALRVQFAKEGAAYGGAIGAGSGNDLGERVSGGIGGAAAGAALGALTPDVAAVIANSHSGNLPAIDRSAEGIAERAAKADIRQAAATETAGRAAAYEAAQRQGIPILPQDVGSQGVGRATQGLAQTPFGSGQIKQAADRLVGRFAGRVQDLADGDPSARDIGDMVGARFAQQASTATRRADADSAFVQQAAGATAVDETGAGQIIKSGVSTFMENTAERANQLYAQVPVPDNTPAAVSNTRAYLDEITQGLKSNPELSRLWADNPRLKGTLQAIDGATQNDLDVAVETARKAVDNAQAKLRGAGAAERDTVRQELINARSALTEATQAAQAGPQPALDWRDLRHLRSIVGDALDDPRLAERIAPRQLRGLYGALTRDLAETAREVGPHAVKAWKRANDYYDGRMKRITNTLALVVGERKDVASNAVFSRLQGMLRSGSTGNDAAFARTLRSIPPEDAAAVRATIIKEARGGKTFDPDLFAREWAGLSERGKAALIPELGARRVMDDAAAKAALNSRNPFAGLSGEQVFQNLERMAGAKGDATRFRATMAQLSPEEANAVRALFINQGGAAGPGAQNAAGDAFSIGRWLTRWNTLSREAKMALFGDGELRHAMNDLALIAERVKATERLAGHSNTGAVNSFNATTGGLAGAAGAALTGHPIIAATLASPAIYQHLSAKMLTSPRLVRWLARAPKSTAATMPYIDRLSRIARSEPALANDVLGLQQRLRDAFATGASARLAADEPVDAPPGIEVQQQQQDQEAPQ